MKINPNAGGPGPGKVESSESATDVRQTGGASPATEVSPTADPLARIGDGLTLSDLRDEQQLERLLRSSAGVLVDEAAADLGAPAQLDREALIEWMTRDPITRQQMIDFLESSLA